MFAWMLWGDFCFTMMEAVVPSIIPLKMNGLGASSTLISLMMTSVPAVFNFTITPTISIWSDRLRTKWGRRMPFIIGSLPFLTFSMILIGFNDDIAAFVHKNFFDGGAYDQTKVAIILLACSVAMFELFNMFVSTVYWYLFNDIVPEHMLGRFMSLFRLVGTLAGMFYNFFVFQYAESHMKEIYIGVALLYGIGFGLVCWRVREGTYPAPPESEPSANWRQSMVNTLKGFYRDCFTSWYYWCFILDAAIVCLAAFGPFYVFQSKSLGLNLGNIGFMAGLGQGAMLICYIFVGKFVDKWHPVRGTAYLQAFIVFNAFNTWIWLFIKSPDPFIYMWIVSVSSVVFMPLFTTSHQVAGMTRWMRLLPKDKLGQFSGAMCLVRAVFIFAAGFLSGGFIDFMKYLNPPSASDPEGLFGYRFMFLASGVIGAVAFFFHYKVYRGWKRLGGDVSYVAPDSSVKVEKLPPVAGDTGRVEKGPLLVAGWAGFGGILCQLVWVGFYTWWNPNTHYAGLFAISAGFQVIILLLYLRFIKFMERP
jgi:hypothetical protein